MPHRAFTDAGPRLKDDLCFELARHAFTAAPVHHTRLRRSGRRRQRSGTDTLGFSPSTLAVIAAHVPSLARRCSEPMLSLRWHARRDVRLDEIPPPPPPGVGDASGACATRATCVNDWPGWA